MDSARRLARWLMSLLTTRNLWLRGLVLFIVAAPVDFIFELPAVHQSALAQISRQLNDAAFRLREDTVGDGDPVLFLDIDDRTVSRLSPAPGTFAMPVAATPRGVLARVLDFVRKAPAASTPRVVVVDIDVAATASDGAAGVASLQSALAAWAGSTSAPHLLIERDTYPAKALGMDSRAQVLPDTPYDATVEAAPNIHWASTTVLGDQNGVVREYQPYQCVLTRSGTAPLLSAALLGYQYVERDPNGFAVAWTRHWLSDAAEHCRSQPYTQLARGEPIDYHLSFEVDSASRARLTWPSVSPTWPGFQKCRNTDAAIFRPLSAIDLIDALSTGPNVSADLLCQRIVIIGGTNAVTADVVQTPVGEMNRSVVIANAIRGTELSHGGLRPIPFLGELALTSMLCVFIAPGSTLPRRIRDNYRQRRRRRGRVTRTSRLLAAPFHPIVLGAGFVLAAQVIGVALAYVFLRYGLYADFAGPALIASLFALLQDFLSEDENADHHPTLTFAEARARAELDDRDLRQALATGALPARKAEGRWHIHQDDLEIFRRARLNAQRRKTRRRWWRPLARPGAKDSP